MCPGQFVRLWGSTLGLTQGPGSFVCPGQVRREVLVCPGQASDSGARLWLTQGPGSFVCPGQVRARFVCLVCPGQVRVSGPGSFVCPGQVRSCVRARFVRESVCPTRESSCVRARLTRARLTQGPGSFVSSSVCPGQVRPCVRARFVRVSGPGSSVCPGQFVRVCPSQVRGRRRSLALGRRRAGRREPPGLSRGRVEAIRSGSGIQVEEAGWSGRYPMSAALPSPPSALSSPKE